ITSNNFVIQFLADLLNKPVATIGMPDVSALGAAYLAGLQAGVYESIDALKKLNSDRKNYLPRLDLTKVKEDYTSWQKTINN
ncbi:MAG TPA: carbohydrate kinase, partial [Chitinophagaceae bacterium]